MLTSAQKISLCLFLAGGALLAAAGVCALVTRSLSTIVRVLLGAGVIVAALGGVVLASHNIAEANLALEEIRDHPVRGTVTRVIRTSSIRETNENTVFNYLCEVRTESGETIEWEKHTNWFEARRLGDGSGLVGQQVALRRTERGYETEEEIAYRRKMAIFGLVLALACALLPLFLIMRRFRR